MLPTFIPWLGPQMANKTYARISQLASLDAQLWRTGIDAHRGLLQITSEFIPTRLKQLTG